MSQNSTFYYLKTLVKGSVSMGFTEGISKLIGLLLLPLFTFYLTPEDYGLISIVTLISTFLNLLYNPGILSATTRLYYIANDEITKQELIGSASKFFVLFPLIITILLIIIGPFFLDNIFKNIPFYPYIFFGLLLAQLTQSKRLWLTLNSLLFRLHTTTKYTIIALFLGTGVSVILVMVLKLGAVGRLIAMFPPAILFYIIAYKEINNYTQQKWSFEKIKEIFKLGYPLAIAIWSFEILHLIDRLIIERMLDIKSVGLYSFGYQIAELPLIIILGFRQLWSPVFYQNMKDQSYQSIGKLLNIYLVVVSLVISFLILFNKEGILLLVNKGYIGSISVIGLIGLGIYFNAMLTLSNTMLGYEQKFSTTSIIALVSAIVNVLLNIYLIPFMGIMGSALATAISYFIYFIWGFFKVRKLSAQFNFNNKLALPTIFVIISYLITMIYPDPKIDWVEILIKASFFFTFMLIFLLPYFSNFRTLLRNKTSII
jgi:O-antigen/teichoic acid export membrane protein